MGEKRKTDNRMTGEKEKNNNPQHEFQISYSIFFSNGHIFKCSLKFNPKWTLKTLTCTLISPAKWRDAERKERLRRKPSQGVDKDEEAYEDREKEEPGKRLLPHKLEGA